MDINRNFDFLWDFTKCFAPDSGIQNSTDPCDYQIYVGPHAASEPETRNAVWMLDTFPNIGYIIDVHSCSEKILYCWSDDLIQTTKPTMNFRNSAYDGTRGITDDRAYREYMPAVDKKALVKLAKVMQRAVKAVRGREYQVEQGVVLYPTAGTSQDYAFSRHLIDPSKGKVMGFVIEWGSLNNPTPFHPPYNEMAKIIQEVTAGLLAFCVGAGAPTRNAA